jgi:hypothetical protein
LMLAWCEWFKQTGSLHWKGASCQCISHKIMHTSPHAFLHIVQRTCKVLHRCWYLYACGLHLLHSIVPDDRHIHAESGFIKKLCSQQLNLQALLTDGTNATCLSYFWCCACVFLPEPVYPSVANRSCMDELYIHL